MTLFEYFYLLANRLVTTVSELNIVGFLETPVPTIMDVSFDGILPIISIGTVPLSYYIVMSGWLIILTLMIWKFFFGIIGPILKLFKPF